ncbi:hypothetical protein AMTRI_Chr02g218760 [Amborella trichopoda]
MKVFEVTLISAVELQLQRSTERNIYAVLWIAPQEKQQQIKQKSKIVNAGGRVDVIWKEKFIFHVDDNFLFNQTSQDDENASSVIVKIYEKRGFLLSDKLLGSARIHLSNLIGYSDWGFASMLLTRSSGRIQGKVNLSAAFWNGDSLLLSNFRLVERHVKKDRHLERDVREKGLRRIG